MSEARSFKVEGFDDLFRRMDQLAEEVGKTKTDRIWKKAMSYAFTPVLEDARSNAPVDSGQLAKHIYMKVQRPAARDKASLSYRGESLMVRVTSGPKRDDSYKHTTITKTGKERVTYTHRPVALANEFGTAEKPAKPYLRTALERNIQQVIERLGSAVWYELEWGKWAKKGK